MAVIGVLQSQKAPEKKVKDGQDQVAVDVDSTVNVEIRLVAVIVEQVVVVGATVYLSSSISIPVARILVCPPTSANSGVMFSMAL